MKHFVLAIALTGLMSVTVLAGDIPINGAPAPPPPAQSVAGDIPTNGAPAPPPAQSVAGEVPINGAPATPAQSATVSTALANVVLTILLIGR